jgi:hypothetical protein
VIIAAVIGTIAIVALTVAVGITIDRKAKLVPSPEGVAKKPAGYAAGEAASTAIRANADQINRLRASQRCPSCRGAMVGEPDDHVTFDNRTLLVLAFLCERCGARRSLYVEHR